MREFSQADADRYGNGVLLASVLPVSETR